MTRVDLLLSPGFGLALFVGCGWCIGWVDAFRPKGVCLYSSY